MPGRPVTLRTRAAWTTPDHAPEVGRGERGSAFVTHGVHDGDHPPAPDPAPARGPAGLHRHRFDRGGRARAAEEPPPSAPFWQIPDATWRK